MTITKTYFPFFSVTDPEKSIGDLKVLRCISRGTQKGLLRIKSSLEVLLMIWTYNSMAGALKSGSTWQKSGSLLIAF